MAGSWHFGFEFTSYCLQLWDLRQVAFLRALVSLFRERNDTYFPQLLWNRRGCIKGAWHSVNGSLLRGSNYERKMMSGNWVLALPTLTDPKPPLPVSLIFSSSPIHLPAPASLSFNQNLMIKWICIVCRERNWKGAEWVDMSWRPPEKRLDFSLVLCHLSHVDTLVFLKCLWKTQRKLSRSCLPLEEDREQTSVF